VDPDESADSIRKRMAELRRDLLIDVQEVSRSAKAMASPGYFVRRFPWATIAIAAGVGYLLIPKKKQVVQPDMEALAELVRKKQVRVDTSKAAKESRGMFQTLAVMGITWAARTGMNYMVQQLTTASANKANEPNRATPSPVEVNPNVKR
jgi:methionyl-tRNA formyltransferase